MPVHVVVYGERLDLADELQEDFIAEAREAVTEGAQILLDDVLRRLRLRAGTFKSAAPPGQPPEYDIGTLFRSFHLLSARIRGATAEAGVASADPSANRLEFGKTDINGVRTFPHPYMRPALEATEEPIAQMFEARFGPENVRRGHPLGGVAR